MKAGRVRPLAIASDQRLVQYPDVPTMSEVGFPGVKASQWVAAFAPSATPREIIDTLHGAFAKAAATPELQEAFEKGGMKAPAQSSLENEKTWLRDEMAGWKRVVEELRITVEE